MKDKLIIPTLKILVKALQWRKSRTFNYWLPSSRMWKSCFL